MNPVVRLVVITVFSCVAVTVQTGCETSGSAEEGGSVIDFTPPVATAPDPGSTVCDPFNQGGTQTERTQGISAQLFYLNDSQPRYNQVRDYIAYGQPVTDISIFMSQLNIPTRPFDRGFSTLAGNLILNQNGNNLYEYFALNLKGRLKLGANDAAGAYQLAILSDDGAILQLDTGSGLAEHVNNDGFHPTQMKCASAPLDMTSDSRVPFQLDYFQGPRYHISLILMWRPWPADSTQVNDAMCGRSGNSLFFDSTQDPPTPKSAYNGLLARGWKPLSTDNFILPEKAPNNPCNEPAPTITAVSVKNITRSSATVSWTTDRPANTQVRITEVATGAITYSTLDPALVTSHLTSLSGLKSNTLYTINAVSASISGASTSSADVTFRTAR